MNMQKLDHWHKSRVGYLVFALVELGLAYAFVSLAIDRGDWWWYVLTLLFTAGFLQNGIRFALTISKKAKD
jgi:hypothetical protein